MVLFGPTQAKDSIFRSAPDSGLSARDIKHRVGNFFNGMTNLIMHKYGVDVSPDHDPDVEPEDPDEAMASVSLVQVDRSHEEKEEFVEKKSSCSPGMSLSFSLFTC